MKIQECIIYFTAIILRASLAVGEDLIKPIEPIEETVYDFSMEKIDGNVVSLNSYKGNVLIIVNYASTCGFTAINVNWLSEMAKKYKENGLSVLLFPSNSFFQNFGGNTFAKNLAYQYPEFDVFSEINVNGWNEARLYTFLKHKLPGLFGSSSIKWNFTKFLVDRNGYPVERYSCMENFENIEKSIKELLIQSTPNEITIDK